MEPPDRPKWLRITILLISLAIISYLFIYSRDGRKDEHAWLMALLSCAILCVLANIGYIKLPLQIDVPFLKLWPQLSDFIKATLSFCLVFVWSPIALKFVPDSNLGMLIVVGPDVAFIFLALLFTSNGLSRNIK